jgi:hypothetical protein
MSSPSIEKRVFPRKCAVEKSLERLDLGETIENGFDAVGVHRRQEPSGFSGMPEPLTFLGHEDVCVVETGGRAVNAAELVDRLVRVR